MYKKLRITEKKNLFDSFTDISPFIVFILIFQNVDFEHCSTLTSIVCHEYYSLSVYTVSTLHIIFVRKNPDRRWKWRSQGKNN